MLVSLHGSKENEFLVNILRQHIPEMNVKNTLICKTCHSILQGILSFVLKCLEVEEKINKYIETEETDAGGQIELRHVQIFIFRPIVKLEIESFVANKLEERCDQICKEYTTASVVTTGNKR